MRFLSLAVLLVCTPSLLADETRALVENAIKAHGGEAAVAKLRTMRIRVEGKMDLARGESATKFTIEDVWQMPDKYRTQGEYTSSGMKATQTEVLDGDKGWAEVNGNVLDIAKDALN